MSKSLWPINGLVPEWRRSARCETGACVEVAVLADGTIGMRDSEDPNGPVLTFNPAAWRAFVAGLKAS